MEHLITENEYKSPQTSPSCFSRRFPSLVFYHKFVQLILRGTKAVKNGQLTSERRIMSTDEMIQKMESVGVSFHIENTMSFRNLDSPCVFVSNHMSTMETFFFTSIIEPYRKHTYVIKESLVRYPVFKDIMISLEPVVVTRENPREDLQTILREGEERLKRNISVVVFPQTTRNPNFIPEEFNSVGVKLARRAKVPVIPIAIKTDAWGNSKRFVKEFGAIDPGKPVHFCFGNPINIQGNGKNEHEQIIRFIAEKLAEWN